jgi:hypothetical protein
MPPISLNKNDKIHSHIHDKNIFFRVREAYSPCSRKISQKVYKGKISTIVMLQCSVHRVYTTFVSLYLSQMNYIWIIYASAITDNADI